MIITKEKYIKSKKILKVQIIDCYREDKIK